MTINQCLDAEEYSICGIVTQYFGVKLTKYDLKPVIHQVTGERGCQCQAWPIRSTGLGGVTTLYTLVST